MISLFFFSFWSFFFDVESGKKNLLELKEQKIREVKIQNFDLIFEIQKIREKKGVGIRRQTRTLVGVEKKCQIKQTNFKNRDFTP